MRWAAPSIAPIFFGLYIFIVVLVSLNLIIAIVVDIGIGIGMGLLSSQPMIKMGAN